MKWGNRQKREEQQSGEHDSILPLCCLISAVEMHITEIRFETTGKQREEVCVNIEQQQQQMQTGVEQKNMETFY